MTDAGPPPGTQVAALASTFAAEVSGVDLETPPGDDWLAGLLARHRVLIFRDQNVSRAGQVALARLLGTPTPAHPVVPGEGDHPEILVLDGAAGGRNARWHTDVTFVVQPPSASVLVAEQVPAHGGDTLWADLAGAYDHLAPPVRGAFDGLQAVHRITPLAYWGEPADTAMGRQDAQDLLEAARALPAVRHPVVRVHPRTGRPGLFVNPGFTSHICGLSRLESGHLLGLAFEHSTQPELTYRHHWRPGDVAIWDNQATMHYAADDYASAPRRMRRVTVAGAIPVGLDGRRSEVVDDPLDTVR